MYCLEKLKSNRIYNKKIKIAQINKSNKDLMKNTCVLFLGTNDYDIVKLINSELFAKNYYKCLYANRILTNIVNNKKVFIDIGDYYKKVNEMTKTNLMCKRNIKDYNKKNLYYDFTRENNIYFKYVKLKGKNKINQYMNNIDEKLNLISKTYKNIVLYVPIDYSNKNIDVNQYFALSKANDKSNDNVRYFYYIFKNKDLYDRFVEITADNNINIIFQDINTSRFIKVDLNSDVKRNKYLTMLRTLIKTSANIELNNEEKYMIEESEKDEKESVIDDKNHDKANVIINSVKDNLNIKRKNLNDKEEELLSDMLNTTVNVLNTNNFNNDREILSALNKNKSFKNNLAKLKDIQDLGNNNAENSNIDEVNAKNIKKEEEQETQRTVILTDKDKKRKEVAILKTKQDNVKVGNKTIKDILEGNKDYKIEKSKIKTNVIHENVKNKTKIKDFDNSYIKNNFETDLLRTFTAFNDDEDINLYVKEIEKENTSTELTKKRTYTIKFKDDRNVNHTFKFDLPIIKDGKYIYINGSRKLIQKQIFLKPIVKTKSDTVQITTDYLKLFITREGQKLSEQIEILKKFFLNPDLKLFLDKTTKIKKGNVVLLNNTFKVGLSYNNFAEFIEKIELDDKVIDFNQSEINDMLNEKSPNYNKKLASFEYDKEDNQIIGWFKKNMIPIFLNMSDEAIYTYGNDGYENIATNMSMFIINELEKHMNDEGKKVLRSIKAPSSVSYNRVRINNNPIPLIIVLGYELGLRKILDKYNIEYTFSSNNVKRDIFDSNSKSVIRFNDGYLLYDNSKIRNSLLLDGIKFLNPENYSFDMFGVNGLPYIEYFNISFGSRNTGKGIHNTLSLLIDPKTKEVLSTLKLPTNVYDVLLYANTLLETNKFNRLNDMNSYRIRGAEQINAIMYKVMADSFKVYKDTSKNANPIKMSVPQDIIIKKLMELKTVDEASTLNPSLEIEKQGGATYKGPSGTNMDDAYTTEIRSYDESMYGIFGFSTPDSNKVGVVRQLTSNPAITNTLGFLDTNSKDIDPTTDIYTTSEILKPFCAKYSDPPRIGMMSTQQKHILATKKISKPLFGSGMEKTLPYLLSDDFVFKAKEDGKVLKIDKTNNVAILQYNSGEKDVIDLNPEMSKNSNGGFYISNKKDILLQEGESFKADEILAKNSQFFTGNKGDISYTMGVLSKVAIASSDATYEDSSLVSRQLSKDMTSYITMKKQFCIGPNANIEFIVKKGQKVNTGDPLIIYENSFEDEKINELLAKLGSDFGETVDNLSKNAYKSKYTGRVVDIQMYYNRDIEEFSPSIQKHLKKYLKDANARKKIIIDNVSEENIIDKNLPSTSKQEGTKIKGVEVDGLMIEFFIEYEDVLGIGDKITFYGPCKTIVSDVLEDDERPFSENDPDEPINAVLSPLSLVSRMVLDISLMAYSSKVLINLKRQCRDIFDE